MKKKELVIADSWCHKVLNAEMALLGITFTVDVLALEPGEESQVAINIMLTPGNGLAFAVSADSNWQYFKNADELIKAINDVEIVNRVYFGLFKLWQCLEPKHTNAMVMRHELYIGELFDVENDKASDAYYKRLVYATNHMYKYVKRILLRETPDWSVTSTPIVHLRKPFRPLTNFDE